MLDNLSLDSNNNNNKPRIITKSQMFFLLNFKRIRDRFLSDSTNINRRHRNGRTLLHAAVCYREIKIVSTLLDHIDKDEKDDDGVTPLHLAAHFGIKEIVALLVAYRADVNAKDNHGVTALHRAAYNNTTMILNLLIENCSNINEKDNNGNTPLHWASFIGIKKSVKVLIHKGADINVRNCNGETPLDLARKNNKKNIVELLETIKSKEKKGEPVVPVGLDISNNQIAYLTEQIHTVKIEESTSTSSQCQGSEKILVQYVTTGNGS